MTWYAASAIDDAFDATKRFLFPFRWGRWLKLAIVAFFLGGAGGGFNVPSGTGNFDLPSGGNGGTGATGGAGTTGGVGSPGAGDVAIPGGGPELGGLGDAELAVVIGIVVLFVLVALLFAIVGAVMEFVLLDALRTNDVQLRRYFSGRFSKGVRLFAFRLGIGLLLALAIGALVVGGILLTNGGSGSGSGPGPILGALAVGVPLIVVLVAISTVVLGLTTDFVAPVMVVEDVGVLAGWRRFWPTLRTRWKQYGLYLVVRLILAIAVGIAAALATVIAIVALLIGFGVVAALAAFALGGPEALVSSTLGIAVVAVLGILFLLSALAVVLVVRIPVVTYFRCYALSVLGDTEPAFDLLDGLRGGDGDESTDPTPAGG